MNCFLLIIPNINLLYVIRVSTGFTGCFWTFLSLIMVREIICVKYKTTISNLFYVFYIGGINLSYVIASDLNINRWQFVMLFPIIIDLPRFFLVLFFYKIESPNFLYNKYSKNPSKNIKEILYKNYLVFYDEKNSELVTEHYLAEKKRLEDNSDNKIKIKNLFKKDYRFQLFFGIILNVATQMTGANVLRLFSTKIYLDMGLSNPELLTTFMGLCNFLSAVLSAVIGHKIGKRIPLFLSLIFQSLSLTIFILGFHFDIGVLSILGSYLFIFFFGFYNGILFSYVVDILPSIGISFSNIFRWTLAMLLIKYALFFIDTLGLKAVLGFFAIFGFLTGIYFIGYSVETDKKTDSEILTAFKKKRFMR